MQPIEVGFIDKLMVPTIPLRRFHPPPDQRGGEQTVCGVVDMDLTILARPNGLAMA